MSTSLVLPKRERDVLERGSRRPFLLEEFGSVLNWNNPLEGRLNKSEPFLVARINGRGMSVVQTNVLDVCEEISSSDVPEILKQGYSLLVDGGYFETDHPWHDQVVVHVDSGRIRPWTLGDIEHSSHPLVRDYFRPWDFNQLIPKNYSILFLNKKRSL